MTSRPRRRGNYVPLAARYYEDEAILRAGQRAELLYVRGLAFCASSGTDGFISDAQVRLIGRDMRDLPQRCRQLTAVGLWARHQERGGFQIVSWLKWNPSMEDILAAQRRDADRKRGVRSARTAGGIRGESGRSRAGIPPPDTDTDTDTGSPPSTAWTDGGLPGGDAAEREPGAPPWLRGPGPSGRRQSMNPRPVKPPDAADWRAPRAAAPPPDLTEVRAQLAAAAHNAKIKAARRSGALDELRARTQPPSEPRSDNEPPADTPAAPPATSGPARSVTAGRRAPDEHDVSSAVPEPERRQ